MASLKSGCKRSGGIAAPGNGATSPGIGTGQTERMPSTFDHPAAPSPDRYQRIPSAIDTFHQMPPATQTTSRENAVTPSTSDTYAPKSILENEPNFPPSHTRTDTQTTSPENVATPSTSDTDTLESVLENEPNFPPPSRQAHAPGQSQERWKSKNQ